MRSRLLLTFVAIALLPAISQADDLADLLKRVPGDMNTVAIINVREINKSPRAVKEKWRDNHETEYLAGAAAVPAWVSVVVIGADLHPGSMMHGRSVAMIPVDYSLNSESIAKRENGVVQTNNDLTLVLSPQRGYFGFPAGGIVAISGTMPRQDFAKWLRSAKNPTKPAISSYLQDAVAANKDAHIIVAMDLADAIDPTSVRAKIQQAGTASGDAQVQSLVTVLGGIRGVVFTAQITETTKAQLRFDFSIPVGDFVEGFQRLWPKAMAASGLEIDEFKSATLKADGKSLVVTADLSDASLRRILSVVATPGDAIEAKEGSTIRSPKEAAALSASLRYYRAVNSALDDLKATGGAKGKDYVKSATYFDNYAARIEKLPLTEVDPELVQYGASVGAKLRAMSGSLRGVKVQLETYDNYKSTTYAGTRGSYRWGGGSVAMSTNVQEMDSKSAELVAKLEPERVKIWGILEADRSAIRREMLEKYKIDFEQYKK